MKKRIKCRTCKIYLEFGVTPRANVRYLQCPKCGWLHEWRDLGTLYEVQLRIAGLRDDEWKSLGYPQPIELYRS